MKKVSVSFALMMLLMFNAFADEGMWLPLLLGNKQADMQKNGMKISAEDIYSANHSSLKDAVVLFGRGCTGEFVSSQGLLRIQFHRFPQHGGGGLSDERILGREQISGVALQGLDGNFAGIYAGRYSRGAERCGKCNAG